jgi:hypothetical protein
MEGADKGRRGVGDTSADPPCPIVCSLPEEGHACPLEEGHARPPGHCAREPPDEGGRKRKEERFDLVERSDKVLCCGGTRRQNTPLVCASC